MVIEGGWSAGLGFVVVAIAPLVIPAIAAGAKLLGGLFGSKGAKKASQQQQQASQQALTLGQQQYGQARGDLMPYAQTGGQGLTSLAALAGLPGAGGATPDMLAQLQQSPGYQFRLGEGLKALERSAASRGTLLTGGTLKGLERYAQDYASNEYQQRFNQLAGLTQMGQQAAGAQATLGQNYANFGGNLLTGAGNAAAAGTVGSHNAWADALGGAGNIGLQYWLSQQPYGGGDPYQYRTPPYWPMGLPPQAGVTLPGPTPPPRRT